MAQKSRTKGRTKGKHVQNKQNHDHSDHNESQSHPHPSTTRRRSKSICGIPLFPYEVVPDWIRDNPYLRGGYRVNLNWRTSIRSVCHLHNETFNVWTHIIGFAAVAALLALTFITMSPHGLDWVSLQVEPAAPMQCIPVNGVCQTTEPTPNWLRSFAYYLHHTEDIDPYQLIPHPQLPEIPSFEDAKQVVAEVVEKLHLRLPSLAEATRLLREKADLIKSQVFDNQSLAGQEGYPEVLTGSNIPGVDMATLKAKFVEYIANVEQGVEKLKQALSTVDAQHSLNITDIILHKASLESIKHTLAGEVSDVMEVTRSILSDFSAAASTEGGGYAISLTPLYGAQPLGYLSRWPLVAFMLSAMACLLFSALYHLFSSISEKIATNFQALDYAGICLLISGSLMPLVYYGFYCDPWWQAFHIRSSVLICGSGFLVSVLPYFRGLEWRELRTLMFVAMGISGCIPVTHLILHLGYVHWILWYLALMGLFYLGGACIYLSRIPERWFPGRFDIFFSSHQLWHVCIILAVFTHYVGVVHFYKWRMVSRCLLP